jgi:hypothetical protein
MPVPSTILSRITGTVKQGAFGDFNGWVRVTPDAPVLSRSISPNLVVLGIAEKKPIVNSVLDFGLLPSPDVTYRIEIGSDVLVTPAQLQVLNADGTVQTPYSPPVYAEAVYLDWHCLIPRMPNITLDMLLPIQIRTGHLDNSFFRVLDILKSNPEFRGMLIDIFRPMGVWSDLTYYSKFDFVAFNGKTYVCVSPIPSQGSLTPDLDPAHWQLLLGGNLKYGG